VKQPHVWLETNFTPSSRSSGPTDSLAPPASPYPQQIEPSPVDSNGTENTEIEEDVQEEDIKSPDSRRRESYEVQSPDIEITSPESAKSVWPSHVALTEIVC
jgi:hypothetical protein